MLSTPEQIMLKLWKYCKHGLFKLPLFLPSHKIIFYCWEDNNLTTAGSRTARATRLTDLSRVQCPTSPRTLLGKRMKCPGSENCKLNNSVLDITGWSLVFHLLLLKFKAACIVKMSAKQEQSLSKVCPYYRFTVVSSQVSKVSLDLGLKSPSRTRSAMKHSS